MKRKDARFALLLSLIPLSVMMAGVGQLYAGRIRRGLSILFLGWGFGFLNVVGASTGIGICFALPMTVAFVAWQSWDAVKCAEEYNNEVVLREGN